MFVFLSLVYLFYIIEFWHQHCFHFDISIISHYLQNKQAIISAAESGNEQQLGELIHDIWKDLNSGWKEYWSPIQAGSYENLDSYNKLLDLLVAKAVCEQCGCNMSRNILDLIDKYKSES